MTEVNGSKQFKLLHDVWYVPGANKNLFSMLAAQERLGSDSRFESSATKCQLSVNGVCVCLAR